MNDMKRCRKCGEVKTRDSFSRNHCNKDGMQDRCKECARAYREANRDRIKESNKAYRESRRDELKQKSKSYYDSNRDSLTGQKREYYERNRESIREKQREYYKSNREHYRDRNKSYSENNRDRITAQRRAYRESHREEDNIRARNRRELVGNPCLDRYREITAKYATVRGRWSEVEDAYLIASTDRVIDDALALKRTYGSVCGRLLHLRRCGVALARDGARG